MMTMTRELVVFDASAEPHTDMHECVLDRRPNMRGWLAGIRWRRRTNRKPVSVDGVREETVSMGKFLEGDGKALTFASP